MSYPGLSLDQAPPLAAPFRFFLTAPLFGLAAALFLLWSGADALATRWSAAALVLTHLLTLGVLSMVMFGALLQMLPVVAGSPVAHPRLVAGAAHALLVAGTVALAAGFVLAAPAVLRAAAGLLAAAVGLLAAAALFSLARAPRRHAALLGMALALLALLVAAGLGLWLLAGHGWPQVLLRRGVLTDLHATWALLGWIGILVSGVAFQVVPMFQMTPEYPGWLTRTLNGTVFAALLLATAGLLWPAARVLELCGGLLLAAGSLLFAVVTLDLQRRRKRRLADVTLDFWRLAMGVLLVLVATWVAGRLWPPLAADPRLQLLLGGLFLLGYALSVVNGMLYKIVPFLVWFHLQNRLVQGQLMASGHRVPNMKQVLPPAWTRRQFVLHCAVVALTPPALWWPGACAWLLALALAASMAVLLRNLVSAARLYRSQLATLEALAAA